MNPTEKRQLAARNHSESKAGPLGDRNQEIIGDCGPKSVVKSAGILDFFDVLLLFFLLLVFLVAVIIYCHHVTVIR